MEKQGKTRWLEPGEVVVFNGVRVKVVSVTGDEVLLEIDPAPAENLTAKPASE